MPAVETTRDGSTLIVTMNRPERMNAMTMETYCLLADAWRAGSEDEDVRCFILTGAGGNFSSGADLRDMSGDPGEESSIDTEARLAQDPDIIFKGILKSYRPTKPIIAAVEGVAIAGGTEVLQGTDIRVAGESAKFGVSEVRWSLYPMGGSAVRLARQIPYTEAADILLTGKHISAAEAKRLGLVGYVVPDGEALGKAKEIAATIGENGPLAVEAVLRTLHQTAGMTETEAFAYEHDYGIAVFGSEDAKEGPLAFSQKRKPNFKRR